MQRKITVIGLALLAIGGALSFTAVPTATTQAASNGPTFVIPANDGYGIAECVESGSSCGQVVADAWCEAQGFTRSSSYGVADVDTTGSITASRPISVTCAR